MFSLTETLIATAILALSIGAAFLALRSLNRVLRRPPIQRDSNAPITILKPLRGADEHLEHNLRSFFVQSLGPSQLQLLFAIEGFDDPAIRVVESLIAEFPRVDAKLVVHNGSLAAPNPKVRNLLALMPHARHNNLVISDSNVRVHAHYAEEIAAALENPAVGCVTHLVMPMATDAQIGSLVEWSYLTGYVAPQMALVSQLRIPAAMGKSMGFRRDQLERLGGLSAVSHVLAEDMVLARMFGEAGLLIHTANTPIVQPVAGQTLKGALARITRWSALRARLVKLPYLVEPLSFPLVVALVAALAGALSPWMLFACFLATVLRDLAAQHLLLRTLRVASAHAPTKFSVLYVALTAPLRDVLSVVAWATARLFRHIGWRGNHVRMSTGTRLYVRNL